MRVHRSYIVAVNHIKEILKDTNGYQVMTSSNKKIHVSRTYSEQVNRLRL